MAEIESNTKGGETLSGKFAYLGGGVGLGMFLVFGLLNASFIGGILGINIVGSIFGYPIPSSLVSRMIIGLGMLTGVMVAGLLFVLAGSLSGWLAGTAIQYIRGSHAKTHASQKH